MRRFRHDSHVFADVVGLRGGRQRSFGAPLGLDVAAEEPAWAVRSLRVSRRGHEDEYERRKKKVPERAHGRHYTELPVQLVH
jgi:hypothetical protein